MLLFICVLGVIYFVGSVSSVQYYEEDSMNPEIYMKPAMEPIPHTENRQKLEGKKNLMQLLSPGLYYPETILVKDVSRQKKNFDEIDKAGFPGFTKREFDEIDKSAFSRFYRLFPGINEKLSHDMTNGETRSKFDKRDFDEIDNTGFSGFNKKFSTKSALPKFSRVLNNDIRAI